MPDYQLILDSVNKVCNKVKLAGENAVCTCPFHKDSTPSFSMHMKTGLYICFACGAKGTFTRFLVEALGHTWERAKALAGEWTKFETTDLELPDWDSLKDSFDDLTKIDANLLAYRYCPKYLLDRGFKKEVLARYEVGFDFARNRVVIPVRKKNCDLIGFVTRAVHADSACRYLLDFPRNKVLYGENEASGEIVAVTEGPLDAIAVQQMRWSPSSVATFGAKVSLKQLEKLRAYDEVWLLRDMDRPGAEWSRTIGEYLLPFVSSKQLKIATKYTHDAKDPAEEMLVGKAEANVVLEPYDLWRITT